MTRRELSDPPGRPVTWLVVPRGESEPRKMVATSAFDACRRLGLLMSETESVSRAPEDPTPEAERIARGNAKEARRPRAKKPPSSCAHHGPEFVCDRCPEGHDTDGRGFVHPSERRGRVALRHCSRCDELLTAEAWSDERFGCAECVRSNAAQMPVK